MERLQGCRVAVEALKFFLCHSAGHGAVNEWEHCGQETSYILANSSHFFGMTYCGQHKTVM